MIVLLFKNAFINSIINSKKFVRFKHRADHWSVIRKKKTASMKALEYFDEHYEDIYKKKQWPLMRAALLGKQKYVAIINNFSDNEKTINFLETKGAINVRSIFNAEKEYLLEERKKVQRKSQLENIWKTEAKETKKTQKTSDNLPAKLDYSLKRSLDDAEIDTHRIIDGADSTSILYEFVPVTKLKGREDYMPEPSMRSFYDPNIKENPIKVESEVEINFPKYLNIYCWVEDNQNDFPQPKMGSTTVLNYYLLNGGSILPVLALDLQPGNVVLDMCASPGGKSLIALQTLYPIILHCNDSSVSRTNRIKNVMNQYLYDFDENWLKDGKIEIKTNDGRFIEGRDNYYDRILVDVPCTTDRRSVKEDENNIFRSDRIKERLELPNLQSELLFSAMKMLKPGGIVVYSTCSLSPLQNDAVVHMTIKRLWEETRLEVIVKDLSSALMQFRNVFQFSNKSITRYGHLVLPSIGQNYGPTYFCKIKRVK